MRDVTAGTGENSWDACAGEAWDAAALDRAGPGRDRDRPGGCGEAEGRDEVGGAQGALAAGFTGRPEGV